MSRVTKHSMRRRCGVIAIVTALVAPAAVAETLADALVGAYSHSGLLDQNRALLRAADEDVAIAASVLRPIITWSGDITRQFGKAASGATGGAAKHSKFGGK